MHHVQVAHARKESVPEDAMHNVKEWLQLLLDSFLCLSDNHMRLQLILVSSPPPHGEDEGQEASSAPRQDIQEVP